MLYFADDATGKCAGRFAPRSHGSSLATTNAWFDHSSGGGGGRNLPDMRARSAAIENRPDCCIART